MKLYSGIIISLIFCSCEFLDPRSKYIQLNSNTAFDIIVSNYEVQKGGCIINNQYYIGESFIQKDTLKNKNILKYLDTTYVKNYELENGELLISLANIKPPFLIYKNENSNVMNFVKEQDTLQFRVP